MIYPHAKRWGETEIETKHFCFNCAGFSRGRYGFAHECRIYSYNDDKTRIYKEAEGLSRWCNRTWESHRYITAINDAIKHIRDKEVATLAALEINEYFNKESAKMDEDLTAFQNLWATLKPEQKERLRDSVGMVQNKEQFDAVCTATRMLAAFNMLTATEDSSND